MNNKRDAFSAITFGSRFAEKDRDLTEYFVETVEWRRLINGDVDIIRGPRGSGKSALYKLLLTKQTILRKEHRIFVVRAENPDGHPAFAVLAAASSVTEEKFVRLWQYYFLSLIGDALRKEHFIWNPEARRLVRQLEEANLLPRDLRGISLHRTLTAISFRVGIGLNPSTGVTGEGTLRMDLGSAPPPATDQVRDNLFINDMFADANTALARANLTAWVALDRLDEAFEQSEAVERSALRALLHVYRYFEQFDHIKLKIFLRNDIWRRVAGLDTHVPNAELEPLRILGHIESSEIKWDRETLLNLVMRRVLHNKTLYSVYGIKSESVLRDINRQVELFYRIFPEETGHGIEQSPTFDWMIEHTADGTGNVAPRDLIYLLILSWDHQKIRLDREYPEPPDLRLFDAISLEEALPEVSRYRFEQTLINEYPDVVPWLRLLEGAGAEQTEDTLARIWGVVVKEARERAHRLVDVGFFKQRETLSGIGYWIPFLYRDALKISPFSNK